VKPQPSEAGRERLDLRAAKGVLVAHWLEEDDDDKEEEEEEDDDAVLATRRTVW